MRERLLRQPLGLALTDADRAADRTHLHFAALDGDDVIGTAILVPPCADGVGRIRQVAVDPARRGQGIGGRLMQAAEAAAGHLGALTLALNARLPSVSFYRRLGYLEQGDPFIELTIPHIRMTRPLRAKQE